MFERFTERARFAFASGMETARGHGDGKFDTEHLLLGLLLAPNRAVEALEALRIRTEALRSEIEVGIGPVRQNPDKRARATGQVKKALTLALREALDQGSRDVGTHHLLLGLLREGSRASQLLAAHGLDADLVRSEVRRLA